MQWAPKHNFVSRCGGNDLSRSVVTTLFLVEYFCEYIYDLLLMRMFRNMLCLFNLHHSLIKKIEFFTNN